MALIANSNRVFSRSIYTTFMIENYGQQNQLTPSISGRVVGVRVVDLFRKGMLGWVGRPGLTD